MFCSLEVQEYFIAQTFLSRTYILGATGIEGSKRGHSTIFWGRFFFNFRELGESNKKMVVRKLKEREKIG